MSVFLEIANYYAVADAAFAAAEQRAFQNNDDVAFDQAGLARQHNDQAVLFWYLFSRFEAAVNASSEALLAARLASTAIWSERRIWQAWSRVPVREIALLSKVEVLTDKAGQDYATIKNYYAGRNMIAHGGAWQAQFFVPNVAQTMNNLLQRFATS